MFISRVIRWNCFSKIGRISLSRILQNDDLQCELKRARVITNDGFLECIIQLYNALCTMHAGETMHCKPCYKSKSNIAIYQKWYYFFTVYQNMLNKNTKLHESPWRDCDRSSAFPSLTNANDGLSYHKLFLITIQTGYLVYIIKMTMKVGTIHCADIAHCSYISSWYRVICSTKW